MAKEELGSPLVSGGAVIARSSSDSRTHFAPQPHTQGDGTSGQLLVVLVHSQIHRSSRCPRSSTGLSLVGIGPTPSWLALLALGVWLRACLPRPNAAIPLPPCPRAGGLAAAGNGRAVAWAGPSSLPPGGERARAYKRAALACALGTAAAAEPSSSNITAAAAPSCLPLPAAAAAAASKASP